MPDVTLVPVDHEPDFGSVSFVPVDHNPFSADSMVDQARAQLASQPDRAAGISVRPVEDIGAPAFGDGGQFSPGTAWGNKAGDIGSKLGYGAITSVATLPQRAIENAQYSLDTGNYDPGPNLEAATLPMGTGAIAGVPVRAGEAVLGTGPIRAYHGSPHDFDQFDLSKIGTGEGAQAYGHGLYFADQEATAKAYRDQLSRSIKRPFTPEELTDSIANSIGSKDPNAVFAELQKRQSGGLGKTYGGMYADALPKLTSVEDVMAAMKPPGHMYEVNINADPEHFLDWDKPLSEQHPQTQDAVKQAMGIDYYGKPDPAKAGQMWQQFGSAKAGTAVRQGFIASDDKLVADRLRDAGVPGIKYLDQGSRAAGDGSRNYVVFNHDLINIVRKYAAAGIALPPAIAAEFGQRFKPVDHDPFADQQPVPPGGYTAGLGLH